MPRFIEGQAQKQVTLMPECLDDFIAEDNPVRVVDAFVGELNLQALGFDGAESAAILPKPNTSGARANGRFDRAEFIYIQSDEYEFPAGQRAIYRFTREESGQQIRRYWSSACKQCPIKSQCTPSDPVSLRCCVG